MTALLKQGDRIRLKVRTLSGWKGTGTVAVDQLHPEDGIQFIKDGDHGPPYSGARRHEVAKLRGQP